MKNSFKSATMNECQGRSQQAIHTKNFNANPKLSCSQYIRMNKLQITNRHFQNWNKQTTKVIDSNQDSQASSSNSGEEP